MRKLRHIFRDIPASLTFFILTGVFIWLFTVFTDYELLIGNLGRQYVIQEVIFHIAMSILLALLFAINVYKWRLSKKEKIKSSIIGTIGGFLGILVIGCPVCGVTLAGIIGVGSVVALLPFGGQELKLIGILMLLWANVHLLGNLGNCKLSTSQAKK